MHPRRSLPGACLLAAVLAAGCEDGTIDARTRPPPAELAGDAVGYYCNMIVMNHPGPKGQIFLAGREKPLWFASVRDAVAFTRLPEEPKSVIAIYVNDMGRTNWGRTSRDRPEPGAWTDARSAWYVVGSPMRGGMGAPEAVPFAEREAAERFARERGGRVLAFDAIPDEAVLGAAGQTPGRPEEVVSGAAIRSFGAPNAVEPGSAARPSNVPDATAPGTAARTTGEDDASEAHTTRFAVRGPLQRGPEH